MPKDRKKISIEEKKQIKLEKLKKFYDFANDQLGLENLDINEQIHILVNKCDELMNDICTTADSIKIEDLTKVQEITAIDKKTYLDFVNICSLKNNDKLHEKAINKFEEDFGKRLLITNLRHSFLESYMNGDDLKITDEDNEEYKPFTDYKSNEFNDIMEDSAKKKEYLNLVLWKQYRRYAKAAEYITKLELNYKNFKNLVDWQHYKDGCYPSPTSPSKIWNVFKMAADAYTLLDKYGYNNVINEHEYEFGIKFEKGIPHKVNHKWLETENDLD